MSALATQPVARAPGRALAGLSGVCMLLAAALAIRWNISTRAALDGVDEGLGFGAFLLVVAWAGGIPVTRPTSRGLAAGAITGAALVGVSLVAHWPSVPMQLGHAAPLTWWAGATILVASSEELVLRGALWNWVADLGGDAAALALTTLLFAAMHVPFYGWSVVPLDLGAGLILGGLRLWSGGPAAPAVAHVVADLATWWL
jgi:membrane protease YdiL (CAAX protease family)